MTTRAKYIVFEDTDLSMEIIVVFPEYIKHNLMGTLPGLKVRAGFVDTVLMKCFGRSYSLGLDSDPVKDTNLLRSLLNMPDFPDWLASKIVLKGDGNEQKSPCPLQDS